MHKNFVIEAFMNKIKGRCFQESLLNIGVFIIGITAFAEINIFFLDTPFFQERFNWRIYITRVALVISRRRNDR